MPENISNIIISRQICLSINDYTMASIDKKMRDDFSQKTKELLSKRVGNRCSNPRCRQLTSGPQEDPEKALNVGVAAHITAASPEGPRYDTAISSAERSSPKNGIWLCQKCAKMVDNDPSRYTIKILKNWKTTSESAARDEVEGNTQFISPQVNNDPYQKIENLMPDLMSEMKNDLSEQPLKREFVLLRKKWMYWASGNELVYYFEEHADLKSKIRILENFGLVYDISFNKVDRYNITEELADYLTQYIL